ncbi:hypothetical protein PCASD_01081 [Puccinia coronata f. sp. avenae]|uniref:Uncharacterized protein n=1 Tax=Puccinia coronata f. sp. avenae TaxID=200324 RepID=A0A2N5VLK9_9BASI|nr:hypothetical protein PCASD_01081 [Puccinia coronata f. sp. avenae]
MQDSSFPSWPVSPPPLPPAVEPPVPFTPPRFGVTPFYPPETLPSPFLRTPVEPVPSFSQPDLPPIQPAMSSQPADDKPDYLCMLMESQHNLLLQAQQDRAALAERMTWFKEASAQQIAQLEEAILLMSTKQLEPSDCPCPSASAASDRIDLQRFRTANGPIYPGPFQDAEHFLNWINATQIFFTAKGVSHDTDKIRIVGSLIREVNVLAFYSNRIDSFLQLSWARFKAELFDFALPPLWRTTLRDQLCDLCMRDGDTFTTFSTRARTIQTLVKFDGNAADLGDERPITILDLELAENVAYGLPAELKALVKNHKVLLKRPFRYLEFESRVQLFFKGLPRKASSSRRPTGGLSQTLSTPVTWVSCEETVWRVHSFLDSQGCCHHCKKRCGSAPGSCPNSLNRAFVEIPASFVTPTKPTDYKPPKAAAPSSSGDGKPTQAPAGRALSKTLVSAVADKQAFPDLDASSVAAFATIDEELHLAQEEEDQPDL